MLRNLFLPALCFMIALGSWAQPKPNIVLIMADDIGLGDIGYYHKQRTGKNPVVPTPNIDRLVKEGMRFSDAHSPAPLCAPTRFSMLTGNFCYRNPVNDWGIWQPQINAGIDPQFTTIARLAKQANYHTAFMGKWGLGGVWENEKPNHEGYKKITGGARQFGFDYAVELPQGIQNLPFIVYENGEWIKLDPASEIVDIPFEQTRYPASESGKHLEGAGDSFWNPELIGPMLAGKAVQYIDERAKQIQPFFLYYCSQAVHVPHTPSVTLNNTAIAGKAPSAHGDMISELDAQVGMIVRALKANGVYDNTLIVFTSDNGGLQNDDKMRAAGHHSSNGLTASKGSIYEGGHRVPFIAVWPGKIAANTQSDVTIVGHDMVATVAAMTGIKNDPLQIKDAANLLPVLVNQSKQPLHKYMLYQSNAAGGPYYSIREDDWILVFSNTSRSSFDNLTAIGLYNLSNNTLQNKEQNLLHDAAMSSKINKMTEDFLALRKNDATTLY